ncbi:hypothetical protein Tco_1420386 [Tanacetum coccineum]
MAFSDLAVHKDKTCSNTCLKSFETLKTQYDNLIIEFNKSEFDLATYKRGLASIKEQFVFYKKNEVMFCDQIVVLKRDASFKDSEINALNIQIEKLKKEKESNQIKIDNFENASKSLDKLIGSQISDNNRKGVGYNVVPPPPTGLFAPPTIDLSNSGLKEFQQPEFEGYGFKANKGVCENSSNEIKKTTDAPIIEDWVSDCDEDDSEVMVLKSDNVQQKPKQANQPRKVSENPRNNRTNWNEKKTQKLGVGFQFTKKACFVCGSFNHLIKDCDFHDKKMVQKPVMNNVKKGTGQREVRPVWNNIMRLNHQNFSNFRRNFAPTAVLTKSGIVPINAARQSSSRAAAPVSAARPINTDAPKPFVNVAKTRSNAFQKSYSQSKRPFYQQTTLKNNNLNNKVNTAKVNSVNTTKGNRVTSAIGEQGINAVKSSACWVWRPKIKELDHGDPQVTLNDTGIFDSGCSQHMIGNKSYLTNYQEYDGGFVAFTGSSKGVSAGNRTNIYAGLETNSNTGQAGKEKGLEQEYIILPLLHTSSNVPLSYEEVMSSSKNDAGKKANEQPVCDEGTGKSVVSLGALDLGSQVEFHSMQQHELMDLVTKLTDRIRVLEKDLQQTKKTYSTALTRLVLRVKKLEKNIKTSKARSRARIVILEDEDAAEDSSKQGRKISDIDTDPIISLVQPQQDMEYDFDATASIPVTTAGLEISNTDAAVTTASTSISIVSRPRVSTAKDISSAETLVYIRRSVSKAKDKGKAIMQESEPPKKIKKRVQVQMSIDEELAKKLDEREEVTAKEAHNIDWSDPYVLRYHALQNTSFSIAEVKKNMCMYLKNQVWDQIQSFVPMDSEKEKGSEKKTKRRLKRAGQDVIEEPAKRQKTTEASESVQEQPSEEPKADELSQEQLQQMMLIVPEEGMHIEALQIKYPIIDWEVHSEDTMKFWKIIRVGNQTKVYQVFEDMLKNFNREDLDKLWSLVKERSNSPGLTDDKEKELWIELKRLIEPDDTDTLWKLQRYMHDPLKWWLYDTCGVHHVPTERGHDIFMLAEKDYPLTTALMNLMLCNKL